MKASSDIVFEYIKKPVKEPFAAGEVVLKISSYQRVDRCIYSDVIDTGLGSGLYVLSFQQIDEQGVDGEAINGRRFIYGDPQLFYDSNYIAGVPAVKLAAFLEEETGTFQLAIQLKNAVADGEIRIAWQAQKVELLSQKEQEAEKARAFYISNPPAYLKPGMKYTFSCEKSESLEGRILWSIQGENAGAISKFGTYTAPQKQGVFEIKAELEGTELSSSIFVIVKE